MEATRQSEITCYSGGVVIYHGFSSGPILLSFSNNGTEFVENGTKRRLKVYGDCVIGY